MNGLLDFVPVIFGTCTYGSSTTKKVASTLSTTFVLVTLSCPYTYPRPHQGLVDLKYWSSASQVWLIEKILTPRRY